MARGVRQGCPARGFLFTISFDPILRWTIGTISPRNDDVPGFLHPEARYDPQPAKFLSAMIGPDGRQHVGLLHGASVDWLAPKLLRPSGALSHSWWVSRPMRSHFWGVSGPGPCSRSRLVLKKTINTKDLSLGIDISGINMISKAARFRVVSRSGILAVGVSMIDEAWNSQLALLHVLGHEGHAQWIDVSMSASVHSACRLVMALQRSFLNTKNSQPRWPFHAIKHAHSILRKNKPTCLLKRRLASFWTPASQETHKAPFSPSFT